MNHPQPRFPCSSGRAEARPSPRRASRKGRASARPWGRETSGKSRKNAVGRAFRGSRSNGWSGSLGELAPPGRFKTWRGRFRAGTLRLAVSANGRVAPAGPSEKPEFLSLFPWSCQVKTLQFPMCKDVVGRAVPARRSPSCQREWPAMCGRIFPRFRPTCIRTSHDIPLHVPVSGGEGTRRPTNTVFEPPQTAPNGFRNSVAAAHCVALFPARTRGSASLPVESVAGGSRFRATLGAVRGT